MWSAIGLLGLLTLVLAPGLSGGGGAPGAAGDELARPLGCHYLLSHAEPVSVDLPLELASLLDNDDCGGGGGGGGCCSGGGGSGGGSGSDGGGSGDDGSSSDGSGSGGTDDDGSSGSGSGSGDSGGSGRGGGETSDGGSSGRPGSSDASGSEKSQAPVSTSDAAPEGDLEAAGETPRGVVEARNGGDVMVFESDGSGVIKGSLGATPTATSPGDMITVGLGIGVVLLSVLVVPGRRRDEEVCAEASGTLA